MKWPLYTLCSFSIRRKKAVPFTSLSTVSLPFQYPLFHPFRPNRNRVKSFSSRALHAADQGPKLSSDRDLSPLNGLPWTCPGCGAYSQTHRVDDAGYYSLARNQVATYISGKETPLESQRSSEKRLLHRILGEVSQEILQSAQVSRPSANCKWEPDKLPQYPFVSNLSIWLLC